MQSNKKEVKKAATAAKKAKAAKSNDIQLDVRPYDILCGRSKECFNNIGNRRFRITIGMNVKKYDALPNRTERGKFIVELSRTLRDDAGYRFFRMSKKAGKVELSDDEIRAKIGHALRDLSITQANAAETAANKSVSSGEETKSCTASTPEATTEQCPQHKVVSPHSMVRRVTNDFETDSNGVCVGLPPCPDIQKDESMDVETSHEIPKEIFFVPQHQMISDEAQQSPEAPSTYRDEPVPIEDSSSEGSVHNKDNELGPHEFDLMPLRFDGPDHYLDPISMDMLPEYVDDILSRHCAPVRKQKVDSTEEMLEKLRNMKGFPSPFQTKNHDIMTMELSDDHHMISSGDSIGCLSLDLAIHA